MTDKWVSFGKVAVDSGTLMIGDPCYLIDGGWTEKDYDKYVCERDWEKFFNLVPIGNGKSKVGKGTIFNSGLGDGVYEVSGHIKTVGNWGDRVVEVKIKLI